MVYTGPYSRNGVYYIHKHKENIGRANNKNVDNIAKVFSSYRNKASKAALTQYKNLYKANLLTNSIKLIDEITNNDNILLDMDRQVKNELQKMINVDSLSKLMDLNRQVLDVQEIHKKLVNEKQSFEAFNKLLDLLADAVKIVEGESAEKGSLAALLLANKRQKNFGMAKMSARLSSQLENFIEKNEGKTIKDETLKKTANLINNLARQLTGHYNGTEPLTHQAISGIISKNIFSTALAEGVAAMIRPEVLSTIQKHVQGSLQGDKTIQMQYTDTKGLFANMGTFKAAGKTDIKFNNFKISFNLDGRKKEVLLDIGLSNKFYRTNHFPGLESKTSGKYSSGSGGTLQQAINAIFPHVQKKYLAYNVLVHGNEMPNELIALQDVIVKRQIVTLFSSRGGKEDFSQYMLVNGQLVSILELIQYAQENFSGKSASVLKAEGGSQGLTLSIPNRPAIVAAKKINDAFTRSLIANKEINRAVIKVELDLAKIKTFRT